MRYSSEGYRTQYYVDGNAVRKTEIAQPRRQPRTDEHSRRHENGQAHTHKNAHANASSHRRKKQQVKVAPMNIGYISAMAVAILVVCVVLMSYVKLKSDITNHVTKIAKLESQLYELQLSNDEYYTKIMSGVDLEEIKRIAIAELGMKYAKEGQVVNYTGEGSDYVRQFSEIPSN